jgi:hypothetical protein
VTAAIESEPLRGVQTPRLHVAPRRDSTEAGEAACRFYETMTGRRLLPWQRLAVVEMLAERYLPESDRWKFAASNAGLIVARQNGKGDVLLAVELYFLFVLKVRRIFHTAQLQRTASDAHKRMAQVIKDSPRLLAQLDRGLRGIRYGKGDERIITADGREIIFFTRSDDSGRGLFGDLLVLDEGYDVTDAELAALRPLIKTAESPLVIFTSTPVDEDTMSNGMILSDNRKKALAGAARWLWLEWSCPPKAERGRDRRPKDRLCWAMANPSLGMVVNDEGRILVDEETIEDDLNGMGLRKFLVEDLCCPDFWPDPEKAEAEQIPFDPAEFEARARPGLGFADPVALGIDRSPDGWTSLTVAGWHEDGTWGSETVVHRRGSEWVIDTLALMRGLWEPAVLVIDAAGPAGALVADLLAAGLDPVVTGVAEMGRAAQGMVDDFDEGRYVPSGLDVPLNRAVEIARWRPLGREGARAFARQGAGNIAPLVGAALAGFGLKLHVAFAKKRGSGLSPVAVDAAPTSSGADWAPVDFSTIGF